VSDFQDELHAEPLSESGINDKVLILNFDDNGIKSIYSTKNIQITKQ
jgi:hypothetical protein